MDNVANSPMPLDDAQLHALLAERADEMDRYVSARIPMSLRPLISADDIIQEIWIGAFRTRFAFTATGPNSFDRWLRAIANRRIIDAIKTLTRAKRGRVGQLVRAGAARRTSLGDLFDRVMSSQRTPSRDCSSREAERAMRLALSRLSDDRRTAVQLRFFEGLSRTEIAGRLGKSEAAVNSLIFNGIREMRRHLGSSGRFFTDAASGDGSDGDVAIARNGSSHGSGRS